MITNKVEIWKMEKKFNWFIIKYIRIHVHFSNINLKIKTKL